MFTKIRETIQAFTTPPHIPTKEEQMAAYERAVRESSAGTGRGKLNATVRLGVFFAVLVPTAMLLSQILHRLTHFQGEALGTLGIIVGVAIAWLITSLHSDIMNRIPFHKLNPFFGNKIEETIMAFRSKNQINP
jgi:hypothetical protein